VRFGIAYKLNAIVLLSVLALGGSLGAFFVVEEGRTLRSELDRRVELLAMHLDASVGHAVASHSWAAAAAILDATPLDDEIAYVFVKSADGKVVAGRRTTLTPGPVTEYRLALHAGAIGTDEGEGPRSPGDAVDSQPGPVSGSIAIGVDLSSLQAKRRHLFQRTLAAVVASALLAALLGVGFVRLLLRRSLSPVLGAIRGIGAGELSRRVRADPRDDEIGEIGHAFNLMADQLSTTLVSKTEIEETVVRRTAELTHALEERRRTQQMLLERETRIRLLLDSTAEAIYGIDRDGLCTFANRACAHLLGYGSPEELVGRHMHALIHHSTSDGAAVHEKDCRIYKTLQSHEGYHSDDETFWTSHGVPLPVEVWSYPMLRAGELIGSVVTFLDVSERRRLELELLNMRKLESLGVLAGGIAHDFNNLLMGILGNVSLAKDEDNSGERHTLLAEAEQAALRARNLTQQLLTFSKGGAPVKKVVEIRSIVEEAARFALSGAPARAEFTFPSEPWQVEADAGQLSQVVHNLILNAVQAMPTGGTISVGCENVGLAAGDVGPLPAGRYVRITVRDEGHGIPPDHLHRIFDPYFTTKAGGHGLGLASVYSVVQRHGGHVTVESALGKGTAFAVYLPATDRSAVGSSSQHGVRRTGSGRVLVMDDEPTVRKVATVMLTRLGYDVAAAADGSEALDMVRAAREAGRPFEVLLMDLTVPGGMGGVEAAGRLPLVDSEAVAVATSGYSNDPVMARCRDFGFVGVIAKPYTPADLGQAISEALQVKRRNAGAPT
jgi:PAS domain S-box-containing protein